MPTWARKLVSGAKARFLDEELKIDLDLVYVTDRVIIMGYPAEGMEALYRNNRHDARKFIEHRHGHKYWVFNFCPIKENSYPAEFFRGHVSRYPFPDHHAPPLAIMALATREMDVWLKGDPDRVVVLHCKAGKGRSGTLACAYLLSLEEPPIAPRLERSMPKKERSKLRTEEVLEVVTELSDDDFHVVTLSNSSSDTVDSHSKSGSAGGSASSKAMNKQRTEQGNNPDDHDHLDTHATSFKASDSALSKPLAGVCKKMDPQHPSSALIHSAASTLGTGYSMNQPSEASASTSSLHSILTLHTSRRMKPRKSPNKGSRRGVSIPSQRRFLSYWSQILSNAGPRDFWSKSGSNNIVSSKNDTPTGPVTPKIRIESIHVRMEDPGETRAAAVKVINKVLEKATNGKVRGNDRDRSNVWISVARYDDHFVDTLEKWEKYTRSDTSIGRRKHGTEVLPEDTKGEQGIGSIFEDGKWDSGKMVQSFGQFGSSSDNDVVEGNGKDPRIITHTLRSIPQSEWIEVTKILKTDSKGANAAALGQKANLDDSVDDSMLAVSDDGGPNLSQTPMHESGVVVNANRELRAKLYMGQVPMGWFWFIPAFHMPLLTENELPLGAEAVHFQLKKSDIDFPLGVGAWIIDVDVSMRWVSGGRE